MRTERRLVIRPTRTPIPDLPLAGRSVGHYRLLPGYVDPRRKKPFVQVFWGIAGTGTVRFDAGDLPLPPDHVGVYPGGSHHLVTVLDEPWEYRWWTMDGPQADAVVRGFGLRAGVHRAGPCPVTLFEALDAAIRELTPAGERRAAALAFELLTRAAAGGDTVPGDPLVEGVEAAIRRRWADPELTVTTLAAEAGVHRTLLARRFRAARGVGPRAWLVSRRVQAALARLRESDEPIAAVARACGWSDPDYFSRCIRRATGMSPREFRAR